MIRRGLPLGLLLLVAVITPASAILPRVSIRQVADAITELDVERAATLLEGMSSDFPPVAFERARLAMYKGDCLTAMVILSTPQFKAAPESASLGDVATSCARATVGSKIVEDKTHGIWIRLQEDDDEAFVPFIIDVVARARKSVEADLGVQLPRPLRMDLVRDLFSLAAISGLPVSAAETTGTVAVARWGRVTMISPRAPTHGYPWQDTLAHELAHLVLSRATRDKAPLWLQEGVAKRVETRWRTARPFDDSVSADAIARQALETGQAIGIDQLGPSIAMLPTPEAASTAFAEVSSFVQYWIRENGEAALALLMADLKGLGNQGADGALISVSGYDLVSWKRRWEHHLLNQPNTEAAPAGPPADAPDPNAPDLRSRDVVRHMRLGDLLFARGHSAAAADHFDQSVRSRKQEASLRWRAARAFSDVERQDVSKDRLGSLDQVDGPHGEWLALSARFHKEEGDSKRAEAAFQHAIGLHPMSEDVACEGYWQPRGNRPLADPPLPRDAQRRALCEAARRIPRE